MECFEDIDKRRTLSFVWIFFSFDFSDGLVQGFLSEFGDNFWHLLVEQSKLDHFVFEWGKVFDKVRS